MADCFPPLSIVVHRGLVACGFSVLGSLLVPLLLACPAPLLAAEIIRETDDEAVTAQLRRGLGLWQSGDFARARMVFERVLRLDNLPPDLHEQADVYAETAKAWLDGRPAVLSGYVVAGMGHYRENDTVAGPGQASHGFGGLRIGGRANVPASPTFAMNASLDYRFRRYDDRGRRDDSDLFWSLGGSRALGDVNLGLGTRGWTSGRGDGITRNDAGIYADLRWARGDADQFKFGVELRRRSYPEGRLRDRSRDIIEFSGTWTRALADGRASLSVTARGGREFAADDNPYGDANFVGLSPAFDVTISPDVAAYVFGWWQNGRYNRELLRGEAGDIGAIGTRNDNLYEAGGGVVWGFAPHWEIGPSVLYVRDGSNVPGINYSFTEFTLLLRRDF